jgi:hypothetical protein
MTGIELRKNGNDNIKMNPVGIFLGIEDDDTGDSRPAADLYWPFTYSPPFRRCFVTLHQAAHILLYGLFDLLAPEFFILAQSVYKM